MDMKTIAAKIDALHARLDRKPLGVFKPAEVVDLYLNKLIDRPEARELLGLQKFPSPVHKAQLMRDAVETTSNDIS